MRDIDPALLRAFLTVAELGGMTAAARHLNLTQAAVSQQIKRLETLLDVTLFNREGRKIARTADGERLLPHARRMLAANDQIWGEIKRPDFSGELRVGVPYDIVVPFMPGVLKAFNRAWPRVNITLSCDSSWQLLQRLDAGELDLALTTERDRKEGAEALLTDRLVWVGAKNGEAHRLDPLPVSLGDDHCAFRAAAVDALAAQGRSWRFTCVANDRGALLATLEADLAVIPLLRQSVPVGMTALDADSGLPLLPNFFINLYLGAPARGQEADGAAVEFARFIRENFASRQHRAA